MNQSKIHDFLFQNVSILDGVGTKTIKLLKKKEIEKISDLLWNFPQGFTDRSNLQTLDKLEIGKITTIKVKVIKYNIPRIRNLPNTVKCEDSTGKINIVFFNSREGYIKKILPLNEWVVISGKINFYNKKYQITNPAYVVPLEKEDFVNQTVRVIQNLQSSCLAIQGPPGTGKPWISAKVIIELLKQGKKIGISSNSHKAINNLLKQIEHIAVKEKFEFKGIELNKEDVNVLGGNGGPIKIDNLFFSFVS